MNNRTFARFRAAWFGTLSLGFTLCAIPLYADTSGSVTVTAPREMEQLRQEVDTFVSSAIARPYSRESLLRWDHAMCPLVAGMNHEAGEFVLLRLSQIARAPRAPLGWGARKTHLF